jgi:hypothetical protein
MKGMVVAPQPLAAEAGAAILAAGGNAFDAAIAAAFAQMISDPQMCGLAPSKRSRRHACTVRVGQCLSRGV